MRKEELRIGNIIMFENKDLIEGYCNGFVTELKCNFLVSGVSVYNKDAY